MLADVLLPAALAFIMFSVGLSLEAADFRHVFARPAVLAAALAGQLVLMPLVAFAVARLAGLPGELAVGLMILAACPGGASSAFLTRLARGNIALSLTVTVISSLAAIATFPLLLKLVFSHAASGAFADGIQRLGALPMERLVGSVLAITTLPTALGVAVRHRAGRGGGWRAERIVGQVALVFFAAIVLGTFLAHRQAIVSSLPEVGPAAMLLNLLAMAGGYALVALAGGRRRDSVAAAMECGLQNVGLAIFVAVSLLRQPLMAAPGIVYALVMNAGAFALILLSRKHPGR